MAIVRMTSLTICGGSFFNEPIIFQQLLLSVRVLVACCSLRITSRTDEWNIGKRGPEDFTVVADVAPFFGQSELNLMRYGPTVRPRNDRRFATGGKDRTAKARHRTASKTSLTGVFYE